MYSLLQKLLFKIDPERAHKLTMSALDLSVSVAEPLVKKVFKPIEGKETEVFGFNFKNPVGLAAGFDKNAKYIRSLQHLGFGFLEIGSITNLPCNGNPKPRLFRFPEDKTIVNRMGLNNEGSLSVCKRLRKIYWDVDVPIFVNVAATPNVHSSIDKAVDDYILSMYYIEDLSQVVVLNVSCPNCSDGATFANPDDLDYLLYNIRDADICLNKPIAIKLPHKMDKGKLAEIICIAQCYGISGFTVSNTKLNHRYNESGGYSGSGLKYRNIQTIEFIKNRTDKTVIGVGGIQSPQDAQDYLDAGADLIQIGTGLVYNGPSFIKEIVKSLR